MSDYGINKVCWLAAKDAPFREQLKTDPEAALKSFMPPLLESEQRALLTGDVAALSAMGAHRYLLQNLAVFGLFELDMPGLVQRLRAAYEADPTGRTDISY
jgi:Aromatic-ring-opening dioxygenase LigAB, LigA subunit